MEWTALHFAAENGHAATCKALLAVGAEVDALDVVRAEMLL